MTQQPESTPHVECLDSANHPERHEAPGPESSAGCRAQPTGLFSAACVR